MTHPEGHENWTAEPREREIDAAVRAGMDRALIDYAPMTRETQWKITLLCGPSDGEQQRIKEAWRARTALRRAGGEA